MLSAMAKVPREEFIPVDARPDAYEDGPLPIGYDQTISQPYIVAFMTEQLRPKPSDRVLEIGSGSGYQAAILAELVSDVYTIDISRAAGENCRSNTATLGLQKRARQGRRRLQRLARRGAVRCDHCDLRAGQDSATACRSTQGWRPHGHSRRRTIRPAALSARKEKRAVERKRHDAGSLCADAAGRPETINCSRLALRSAGQRVPSACVCNRNAAHRAAATTI